MSGRDRLKRRPRPGLETPEREWTRRDFIKRIASASAVALGGCGLAAVLLDSTGPPAELAGKALPGLGDFSLPELAGRPGRMAVARGTDRARLFTRAIAALGGIEAFIKPGDRVLIKVNAAFATPASLGATTHPELLLAVAELCRKAGAERVLVADNPIHNPESCFELSGLAEAARAAGAKLVLPRAELFRPATLPGARLIVNWPVMAGAFAGVTKLVAVAPVKDHHRAEASMILKNFYGLLGGRRNVFHQDINGIIAELALLARPSFVVLDGVASMMTNGPTGGSLSDLAATNTLIVSTDPVAADAFGLTLLGRALQDVPYVRLAAEAGAGSADFAALSPVMLDAG